MIDNVLVDAGGRIRWPGHAKYRPHQENALSLKWLALLSLCCRAAPSAAVPDVFDVLPAWRRLLDRHHLRSGGRHSAPGFLLLDRWEQAKGPRCLPDWTLEQRTLERRVGSVFAVRCLLD